MLEGDHSYTFNRGPGAVQVLMWHNEVLNHAVTAPLGDYWPGSDMMKATMSGARILTMGKQLADGVAEVVGPAKFGADGAACLFEDLDRRVGGGQRNQWAYGVFGELAEKLSFSGVDNPGCFWAEVDTVADARDAERRIPRRMIDLVAPATGEAGVRAQVTL